MKDVKGKDNLLHVHWNDFCLSSLSKCVKCKTEGTDLECHLTPHVVGLVLILLTLTG